MKAFSLLLVLLLAGLARADSADDLAYMESLPSVITVGGQTSQSTAVVGGLGSGYINREYNFPDNWAVGFMIDEFQEASFSYIYNPDQGDTVAFPLHGPWDEGSVLPQFSGLGYGDVSAIAPLVGASASSGWGATPTVPEPGSVAVALPFLLALSRRRR